MNKLWLLGLTASAAFAAPAAAQTVSDPSATYGTDSARLNVPLAASAAADRGVAQGVRHVMRHGGDRRGGDWRGDRHGGHHRWSRIHRGGTVPHFWFGTQFVINDWNNYGFPRPFHGGRWIRYYDDALLIDSYGRVHDGRWGYDWSRHRDRWSYRDGVPVYVGRGDFEPGGYDYEWAESWDERDRGRGRGRDRYGDRGRYGRGGPIPADRCGDPCRGAYPRPVDHCSNPCGPAYPSPGYGYGGYGGYVITETTTTTAPVVETETWYEYVTEEVDVAPRRAAPRRAAPAPAPRRAPVYRAPAPRPGERG